MLRCFLADGVRHGPLSINGVQYFAPTTNLLLLERFCEAARPAGDVQLSGFEGVRKRRPPQQEICRVWSTGAWPEQNLIQEQLPFILVMTLRALHWEGLASSMFFFVANEQVTAGRCKTARLWGNCAEIGVLQPYIMERRTPRPTSRACRGSWQSCSCPSTSCLASQTTGRPRCNGAARPSAAREQCCQSRRVTGA